MDGKPRGFCENGRSQIHRELRGLRCQIWEAQGECEEGGRLGIDIALGGRGREGQSEEGQRSGTQVPALQVKGRK